MKTNNKDGAGAGVEKERARDRDALHSLANVATFRKELPSNLVPVVAKYASLLAEYVDFVLEHITMKNAQFRKTIIVRGLNTITHVFVTIFSHTRNAEAAFVHSQRAGYLYIEFVEQITADDKFFLKLTTRDAMLYVYKKILFELNPKFKKISVDIHQSTKLFMVYLLVNLHKTWLLKLLDGLHVPPPEFAALVALWREGVNQNDLAAVLQTKLELLTLDQLVRKLFDDVEDVGYFMSVMQAMVAACTKDKNKLIEWDMKLFFTGKQQQQQQEQHDNDQLEDWDRLDDAYQLHLQQGCHAFITWLV